MIMHIVYIISTRKIIMMMITNIAGDDMDESEHDSDMIMDGGRVGQ
jgi:hypothetical protein